VSEKPGEKLGERKPREKKAAFSRRDRLFSLAVFRTAPQLIEQLQEAKEW